ncbi:hypothetical protein [Streptomyces sp. 1-11]|uniref:hypothetical protein n=1 Tax=Streptomyces sp. 1-11 TaxID=2590549 RepID=UPI00135A9E04|nr:hypothetical protein [Streptomyces sp. 1-11]
MAEVLDEPGTTVKACAMTTSSPNRTARATPCGGTWKPTATTAIRKEVPEARRGTALRRFQHYQDARRHRTRVLPPDLSLSRCAAFVIGLEVQPQIFVLVVGAEPGRHIAILAHDLD